MLKAFITLLVAYLAVAAGLNQPDNDNQLGNNVGNPNNIYENLVQVDYHGNCTGPQGNFQVDFASFRCHTLTGDVEICLISQNIPPNSCCDFQVTGMDASGTVIAVGTTYYCAAYQPSQTTVKLVASTVVYGGGDNMCPVITSYGGNPTSSGFDVFMNAIDPDALACAALNGYDSEAAALASGLFPTGYVVQSWDDCRVNANKGSNVTVNWHLDQASCQGVSLSPADAYVTVANSIHNYTGPQSAFTSHVYINPDDMALGDCKADVTITVSDGACTYQIPLNLTFHEQAPMEICTVLVTPPVISSIDVENGIVLPESPDIQVFTISPGDVVADSDTGELVYSHCLVGPNDQYYTQRYLNQTDSAWCMALLGPMDCHQYVPLGTPFGLQVNQTAKAAFMANLTAADRILAYCLIRIEVCQNVSTGNANDPYVLSCSDTVVGLPVQPIAPEVQDYLNPGYFSQNCFTFNISEPIDLRSLTGFDGLQPTGPCRDVCSSCNTWLDTPPNAPLYGQFNPYNLLRNIDPYPLTIFNATTSCGDGSAYLNQAISGCPAGQMHVPQFNVSCDVCFEDFNFTASTVDSVCAYGPFMVCPPYVATPTYRWYEFAQLSNISAMVDPNLLCAAFSGKPQYFISLLITAQDASNELFISNSEWASLNCSSDSSSPAYCAPGVDALTRDGYDCSAILFSRKRHLPIESRAMEPRRARPTHPGRPQQASHNNKPNGMPQYNVMGFGGMFAAGLDLANVFRIPKSRLPDYIDAHFVFPDQHTRREYMESLTAAVGPNRHYYNSHQFYDPDSQHPDNDWDYSDWSDDEQLTLGEILGITFGVVLMVLFIIIIVIFACRCILGRRSYSAVPMNDSFNF